MLLNSAIRLAQAGYLIVDFFEWITGQNKDIPPFSRRRLIGAPILDVSGREYRLEGDRYLHHLETAAGLRDGITVGDIGCGCGRMARPILTKYRVRYSGFDIVPDLVDWANRLYGSESAEFSVLPVHNSRYNPAGTVKPEMATFPFGNGACEIIHASSVFTHILTETSRRYFAEIKRCLTPTGAAMVTFFLLDIDHPKQAGKVAAGADARILGTPEFAFSDDGLAHFVYRDIPEVMVGYNFSDVQKMAMEAGLEAQLYSAGSWRFQGASESWQDICVFKHAI